jgi:hypothetical protein
MSETPHCLTAARDARYCPDVKFCSGDSGLAHRFLRILMTQVMESKSLGPGFNTVGESRARTAINVLGDPLMLHLRERPCI